MKPVISLVVPVYNCSAYLGPLLDSIIAQTYTNFEVIAVNDGSTDDSLSILQSYANKDHRLRIIDKSNTGVSDTRNTGIRNAQGEFLCCIDADDLLSPDYLSVMHRIAVAENADMVVCGYQPFRGTLTFAQPPHSTSQPVTDASVLLRAGSMTSACIKLIRLSMLRQHEILFDTSMTFGEDLFFCWKAFICADRVVQTEQVLYGYRLTGSGATSHFHADLYEKYTAAFTDLKAFHARIRPEREDERHEMDVFFAQRLPTFVMMTVRGKDSLSGKYRRLRHIVQDCTIQQILQTDYSHLTASRSTAQLFHFAKHNRLLALLITGYGYEMRAALSKLKNRWVKGK